MNDQAEWKTKSTRLRGEEKKGEIQGEGKNTYMHTYSGSGVLQQEFHTYARQASVQDNSHGAEAGA